MPLTRCTENGKPGWKWGASGACYTYAKGNAKSEAQAKEKAMAQSRAIAVNRFIRKSAGRD